MDNEVLVEDVLEGGWRTWLAFWSITSKCHGRQESVILGYLSSEHGPLETAPNC